MVTEREVVLEEREEAGAGAVERGGGAGTDRGLTVLLLGLLALMAAPVALDLWSHWRTYSRPVYGLLILGVAVGHLWARRGQILAAAGRDLGSPAALAAAGALYLAAWFTGELFLQGLTLLGVLLGVVWNLWGTAAARQIAGILGFLVFLLPAPDVLVDWVVHTLRHVSTSYTALLSGMMGLPLLRDGLQISVVPDPQAPPVYSILVAEGCCGLISGMRLLFVSYIVAYHTPVRLVWQAALVALMVPLTLLGNAVRLTLVLLAGAHGNAALAQSVHDHESPVRYLLCSLALIGLRSALLAWDAALRPEEDAPESAVPRRLPRVGRPRLAAALVALALMAVGAPWMSRWRLPEPEKALSLARLDPASRGWVATPETDLADALEPPVRSRSLARRYRSADGDTVSLLAIPAAAPADLPAPSRYLVSGGWEVLAQGPCRFRIGQDDLEGTQAVVTGGEGRVGLLVTQLYTDGEWGTGGLLRFRWRQLLSRLAGRPRQSALVRVSVPLGRDAERAGRLTEEFCAGALPAVLAALRAGNGASRDRDPQLPQ